MQLSTLSEVVGGDMARDAYEMTSPMRVLSYGLGVATYIPPSVAVLGFKSHCPLRRRLRWLWFVRSSYTYSAQELQHLFLPSYHIVPPEGRLGHLRLLRADLRRSDEHNTYIYI